MTAPDFLCPTCAQPRPYAEGHDGPECDECWLASRTLTQRLEMAGLTHVPAGAQSRAVMGRNASMGAST